MKKHLSLIIVIILVLLCGCNDATKSETTPEPKVSVWNSFRNWQVDDHELLEEYEDAVSKWFNEELPEMDEIAYTVLLRDGYIEAVNDNEEIDQYEYLRRLEAKITASRAESCITIELVSDKVTKTGQILLTENGFNMTNAVGEPEVLYEKKGTGSASRIYINGDETRIQRPSGEEYKEEVYNSAEISKALLNAFMPVDSEIIAGDSASTGTGDSSFYIIKLTDATDLYNALLLIKGDNVYEGVEVATWVHYDLARDKIKGMRIDTNLSLLTIAYPAISGEENPAVFDTSKDFSNRPDAYTLIHIGDDDFLRGQ